MRNATVKTAIVTGAGSGIGRAVTLGLVEHGWTVCLAGRRLDRLRETADMAGAPDSLCVSADVTDSASVEALFAAFKARFSRLDLLFNNAGYVATAPLEDLAFEQWRKMFDINVTGAFLCTQQAVRLMKAQEPQGGRIINNGSASAQSPTLNAAGYTASKHAVTGLTRATALEGRPYGIACGQIDIGNAATDMTRGVRASAAQIDSKAASRPMMDVKAVSDAVVYMAGLPAEANVLHMTLLETTMPFVGRG